MSGNENVDGVRTSARALISLMERLDALPGGTYKPGFESLLEAWAANVGLAAEARCEHKAMLEECVMLRSQAAKLLDFVREQRSLTERGADLIALCERSGS